MNEEETHSGLYLTAEETAQLTRLSREKLARLRREGGGPPFRKLGNHCSSRIIYLKSEVIAWIESMKRH